MRIVLLALAFVIASVSAASAQSTYTVCASGCNYTTLQAAVNVAVAGDTITLTAGQTFTGTTTLPAKAGASYITIKSNTSAANMPATDVRVEASHATFMPKLAAPSGGEPALQFAVGSHHYRFQWIEVMPNPQGHNTQIAVGYGDGSQVIPSQQPHDIIFDQVYVHGDTVYGQKRAFELHGTNIQIRNSRVEHIYAIGQDSQCIGGWNGRGPYTIYNNYLDCGTENIMFGGADPTLRTWLTVSGSPSATTATVAVSESGGHTLADLMVDEPISIMTASGIRHTILRTVSGVGASGTITYDSIGATPSTGTSMIRQDSVAMDITIRRNHITKDPDYMDGVLNAPSSVVATAQEGVGSLSVGTYCYKLAAVTPNGGYQGQEVHSAGSTETCATLGTPGRIRLTFNTVSGATSYTLWRGTSSGNQNTFYEGVTTSPFYDDGTLSYTSWSPVPDATKWQIKNLFEIKAARRMQMDSNVLEYSWCGSDICFAVWLKSVNQDNNCWNCGSRDLVFERNVVRHVMGFLELHGTEAAGGQVLPPPMTNITVRNNLVYDSNMTWSDGGQYQYAIFAGDYVVNLTLEHNTIDHLVNGIMNLDGALNSNAGAVIRGNMLRRVEYGIHSSFGEGSAALDDFFPGYVFTTNVVADASSSLYPAGNFFPSSATFEAQFVSYSASGANAITDWALTGASAYNNAAWDGTDIGADITVVSLAVDGVVTGGSSTLTITTTSIPNGALTATYSTTFAATGGTQNSTQTVRIGNNTGNTFSGVTDIDFKEAFPTTNYEGQSDLEIVRWESGDVTHSMIKFTGLSSIPSNAIVTSATIYLYLESAGQSGIETTIQARRVLRNWTAAQASWNSYSTGNSWTTAGALGDGTDRVATVSATSQVGETLGYKAFTGSQLISDVQNMVNGTYSNFGWVFQRNDGLDDFQWRNFTASEGANGQRPYMEVTYTVGGSYAWAVSSGTLPAGLSLNTGSGALTGTPTSAGTSTFTIRVTDAVASTNTRQFTMIVRSAVSVTTSSPLTGGQIQAPYSVNLAATNDEQPYTWSLVSGTIPIGLSFNASGRLSGIPTTAAVSSFTVRVTGSLGSTTTQAYSLTISAGPTIGTGASALVADRLRLNYGPCVLYSGSGSPEGVLTGRPCDMYIDTTAGVWFTKWTGTDTTGWGVGHNADAAVTGDLTLSGHVGLGGFVSRTTGWRIDETGSADFRYLYTDELHARTFIADLEQALAGGQIIAKSVALIEGSFVCPAQGSTSTLRVEDLPSASGMRVFEIGDFVVVRNFSRAAGGLTIGDCVGTVSNPITPGGIQNWTFTRATGANGGTMPVGTTVSHRSLAIDYGTTGNGYIEQNAVDGTYGVNSPYTQIVTWTSAPTAANRTLRSRLGNLRGITGQTEYGAIFGTYGTGAAQYIRASDQAFEIHNVDLSIFDGSTEVIRLDRSTKSLAIGSAVPTSYSSGTGVFIGNDSGTYKLRIGNPSGNRLTWDGSTLTVVGDGGGVTNINGANIQTGTVSASKLTVGTGRNMIRNSDCTVGTADWEYGTTSALGGSQQFSAPSFSPWRLAGQNNTCYTTYPGAPAAGTLSFFFTSTSTLIPVTAGNRYEASGYLGIHRSGNSFVAIQWFDFLGSYISEVHGNNCTSAFQGGLSLGDWCRSGVLGNAPSGASTARVVFYTTHTGESTPYMFVVHAYFGEGLANQTELTPWGASGLTEIIGGMIRTSTITADKISVTSLSALTANVGTLTSGTINGVTIIGGSGAVTLDTNGISISAGTNVYNRITWPSNGIIYGASGNLRFEAAGLAGIGGSGGTTFLASAVDVYPASDAGVSLGTSSNRWFQLHISDFLRVHSFGGGGARYVCTDNGGLFYASASPCI